MIDPRPFLGELGLTHVREVAPVSGGSDTAMFRVVARSGVYALRIFRSDQDESARRELAAIAAAEEGGIPVARVLASSALDRRPVMLLEWVHGIAMREQIEREPNRARELGGLAGVAQARLHAIAGPGAWHHEDSTRWRAENVAVASDDHRLLHLDFHPGNVLVRDSVVVAVIDWVNARSGPPLADVARTYSILAWDPTIPRSLTRLRRELWLGWRQGYEWVAGPLANLAPFVAWAARMMAEDLRLRLPRDQTAILERRALRWTMQVAGRTPC